MSVVSDIQSCSLARRSDNREETLRPSEYNWGKRTNERMDGVEKEGMMK